MERSTELEELTRKLYDAVSKGDISFFERHLSRGESWERIRDRFIFRHRKRGGG